MSHFSGGNLVSPEKYHFDTMDKGFKNTTSTIMYFVRQRANIIEI